MAPTRWGIVSTGKIASDFTTALLPAENHQVVAVAARTVLRAEEFAKVFSIPKAYGTYRELSEDPDIDVIYIGNQHPYHFETCKLMLEAGKNVLCEKPLTLALKQAKDLVALAKEKNVFFMEGFWSRFFPVYHDVREALARGTIGEVKFVQVDFGKVLTRTEGDGFMGLLPAIGVYPIQLALMVFSGEMPEKITASGDVQDGVDCSLFVTLNFSKGRVAQIACHSETTLSRTARIHGTKGSIEMPKFWSPERVVIGDQTYEHPLPGTDRPLNYPTSDGFVYEAEAVRQSIQKGEKENPLMPLEETLRILSICEEIRRQIGVVYDDDKE